MQYVPVGVKRTQLESGNGGAPQKDHTLHICAYCMATWLTACARAYRAPRMLHCRATLEMRLLL